MTRSNHLSIKKVIYLSLLIISNLIIILFFILTFFNHFEYLDSQIRQKWFLIIFFLITGFLLTTYQFNIEGFTVSFNTYIIYFIFFSFDFPITLLFIFIYFFLQTAYLIFIKKHKSHLLMNYFYRIPLWGSLILAMKYMIHYFNVNPNQLTSLALLFLSLYLIVHLCIKYIFHTIQHFTYMKINKLKTGFIIILLIDSPLFLYSFIVATAYQFTSFIIPALFTLSLIAFSSLIKLLHDRHLHQRFYSEQLFFLYPLNTDTVTKLPVIPAGGFSFF